MQLTKVAIRYNISFWNIMKKKCNLYLNLHKQIQHGTDNTATWTVPQPQWLNHHTKACILHQTCSINNYSNQWRNQTEVLEIQQSRQFGNIFFFWWVFVYTLGYIWVLFSIVAFLIPLSILCQKYYVYLYNANEE